MMEMKQMRLTEYTDATPSIGPLPLQVMEIAKNFAYLRLATWASSFISRSW